MGEIAPVVVNDYTNGTVIVKAFTVTGAISPVIVNVHTNGSVYTNGCYIGPYTGGINDMFYHAIKIYIYIYIDLI